MMTPENLETEHIREQSVEKNPELKAEQTIEGAELLENPSDGSFAQGLQVFITWVKNLVADQD